MSITLNELRKLVKEILNEDTMKTSKLDVSGFTSKQHYEKLQFEEQLAINVFKGSINEQANPIIQMIDAGEWESPQDARSFMNSLYSSKRKQFLSPYEEGEFNNMKLFKLKKYSIGFAIKSDGDIIAVHNNEPFSGLGPALMKSAIKNGGTKLDHFDGFLTGLYETNGFPNVVKRDLWNSEYAPSGWQYTPVNIFSSNTSAYAKEPVIQKLKQDPSLEKSMINNKMIPVGFVHAIQNYKDGRPSIIYRTT